MANDFTYDDYCVALYRFESGALTADSFGGNTLTNNNGVAEDLVNFKEGECSADLELSSSQYFSISDDDLDSGFPCKDEEGTNRSFTICGWI
ncbi:unnamed protein product, partial [marine sediment metagenome]